MESTLIAYDGKLDRSQLALVPTPPRTETHQTIPHHEIISTLAESLSFRHIAVVGEEYCVSKDGADMFGLMELDQGFEGGRFALGLRNSNAKRFRFALTVGVRVFVCMNMQFRGEFEPVMHKHSKNFNLKDSLAIGLDSMQRNFEPMKNQIAAWRETQISDDFARATICRAFFEDGLDAPKHLGKVVYHEYFHPTLPDFTPRTEWSLTNSFTAAFKQLDPIPQYRATASLGKFFQGN
jgi:hypothetical protein